MKSVRQTNCNRKKTLRYPLCALLVLGFALGVMVTGCGSTKYVTLTPTPEVRETFKKVDMNPDDYAFFTTGPDATPEAILLISNQYLGEFDSAGWKLRDKQFVIDMLKAISKKKSLGQKFGYPVTDDQGVQKGLLFTTFRVGKMFIDKEEGSFRVATPAMLDIGKGAYKRSSCSISICQ
jgi:hypothetical protein